MPTFMPPFRILVWLTQVGPDRHKDFEYNPVDMLQACIPPDGVTRSEYATYLQENPKWNGQMHVTPKMLSPFGGKDPTQVCHVTAFAHQGSSWGVSISAFMTQGL